MIVGVTDEAKAKVEKFVQDNGIKYAISIDPKAGDTYGVRGIPDAVLVGPDGKVVWKGHPATLKEGPIEEALQNATFISPLPANHARYNVLLKAKKFGKAYQDIKRAVQDGKVPQADASRTLEAIEKRMKSLLEEGEKARSENDFYTAGVKLNALTTLFAGTEEAKRGETVLKEIEKDPKGKDQLKAGTTLQKLQAAMDGRDYTGAYRGYKSLAKKFTGTKIESVANEKIAMIEKEKLLNYRSNCPACKKDGRTCGPHRST